ncbi:MAG TPA: lipid A biosynthesis acyltransferase [Bacteroidales bacterium]|nr:lipid A biosynthesis acyltransferase [Bacteroidales bacterium]
MNKIGYWFFLLSIKLLSLIPFWLLYGIANLVYILLLAFGYRKKVVIANLASAFPEKTVQERKAIMHKYYRNVADILVESLKGFDMKIRKNDLRIKILNPEFLDSYYEQGKHVMINMGHYGNWEWIAHYMPLQTKHVCATIYKPISNPYIDQYMREKRMAGGFKLASIANTRVFMSELTSAEPFVVIFASDQSPSNVSKAIWVNFLNKDTACLQGAEFYSRLYDMPMIFMNVIRVKRGYYEATYSLLCNTPKETVSGELTQIFNAKLEEEIKRIPELWIWSHKRWKHQRQKPE